ncbi:MAG: NUDIX domain-containing protein [Polyangiales bacterium]
MPRRDHLRRLLDGLQPADPLEFEHKQRILQLLSGTEQPFSRAQYAPGHVTASAFVVDPSGRALLLILHAKLHLWLQPGGHVEDDDSDVLAAARREVREEVGIHELTPVGDGLLDVDVHEIPARRDQPAHAHFDVRFLFTTAATSFQAGSDAQAARWIEIDQLLRAAAAPTASELPSDESVLRAVRKLREHPAWR